MDKIKIFIEKNEYLQLLLDEVAHDRFLKATKEGRSSDFYAGALFGLSWAGMITSQCQMYVANDKEK